MSTLAFWIHTSLAQALGWALVHFLWEGAALAILLMAMLAVFRREPARRRYALACFVLAAMPVAFAVTLALLWVRRPVAVPVPIHWLAVTPSTTPIDLRAPRFSWRGLLDRLAWLVPVWCAGVAFFYARGLAGWVAVRRLRRRGVCAPPAEWQTRLDELAARLRISRTVRLLESCITDTPVLIGYLRPVILLPLGCLTGLSASQIECILLHELAHVVRHDYLLNLLQSLVEGLLFYHPAVWWVSRVVRAERENCCDDRVVELVGDARAYAATLAVLEERRAVAPQAALAASGGNLMKRIRRLTMESRVAQPSVAPAFSAAVLLVLFAAALSALPAKLPKGRRAAMPARLAVAEATPQQAVARLATPYQKWLSEDVAYMISEEESAEFRSLTSDAQREAFIDQFWEKRGKEMQEEHYRRIAYANEQFAGTVAGWKTDRGRTYIVYGPPDEIDHHAGDAQAFPFQRWQYRFIKGVGQNVIVEFVDRMRTGDFPMTADPAESQKDPYRAWIKEDVAYIVTDAERAAFQALQSDDERENFIAQFWQRRGLAMKEEHYRRIAYANEHFQTGIPGWKTDRGRIYIMYGPPDEILEAGPGKLEWKYRYLESLGNNASMVFEDAQGNGEWRLINERRPGQAAKVFASSEPTAVSVIVPGRDQVVAPGVIGPGDVLQVGYTAATSTDSQIEAVASRQTQESPIRAELSASISHLRGLQAEWERHSKELHDVQELMAPVPVVVQKHNQLSSVAQLAEDQYLQLAAKDKDKQKDKDNKDKDKDKNRDKDKEKEKDKDKDSPQTQQALKDWQLKKAELAAFEAENQHLMPENISSIAQQINDQKAVIAELNRAIENEKVNQSLLEKSLNQIREKETFPPSTRHVSTQVTVRADGTIKLDNDHAFLTAGLTPAQLEAAIGGGATVRIANPAAQMVTVLVPLPTTSDLFHVYGQVRTAFNKKIAQSFESSVSGQPAVAKAMPLQSGSYHLTVVWKNLTTNATHSSDLDFTVD